MKWKSSAHLTEGFQGPNFERFGFCQMPKKINGISGQRRVLKLGMEKSIPLSVCRFWSLPGIAMGGAK
jgi:hypothetical protein